MNNLPTYKKMIVVIIFCGMICAIVGCIFLSDKIGFIKGISLGTLFSVLKTFLLNLTIDKSLDMTPLKAQIHSTLHYFLRNILTIAVLIVSALEPSINLWGTLIGLISFNVTAYIVAYWEKRVATVSQ